MNNYPYVMSDRTITVIINNVPYQTERSNPRWDDIVAALNDENTEAATLIGLIKPIDTLTNTFSTQGKVSVHSGNVWFENEIINSALTVRILDILAAGLDIDPWVRFMENVYANPNDWSRNELYLFLEKAHLPITHDGCFIAYKRVSSDYKDCHTHSIDNRVGQTVSMPRERVDQNRNNTCSTGLHFCSLDYLDNFGGAHTMLVKINPADVVSIPNDYQNTKGRTWRYEVVGEIEDPHAQQWAPIEAGHGEHQWGPSDDDEFAEYNNYGDPSPDLQAVLEFEQEQDSPSIVFVEVEVPTTKVVIETLANGMIDAVRFSALLAQHGTKSGMARALGVSSGTVQAWATKLFGKVN